VDLAVFGYERWSGDAPEVSRDPTRHLWHNLVVTERYPSVVRWSAPRGMDGPSPLLGVVRCPSCALVARHDLKWPDDAFWRWDVSGSVLWAWSRGHAAAIRDYVDQTHRDASAFPEWRWALQHLPKEFLSAHARDEVVRKINRDLRNA
jgi:hypothetical protein